MHSAAVLRFDMFSTPVLLLFLVVVAVRFVAARVVSVLVACTIPVCYCFWAATLLFSFFKSAMTLVHITAVGDSLQF